MTDIFGSYIVLLIADLGVIKMFKQAMSCALLATFVSCGSSNAIETLPTGNQSAITNQNIDFSGVYDLVDTNTVYNDCGSSIQIIAECGGFKIYNNYTRQTDDFCNVNYPNRNPTFPDRNPPPPDRYPPPPDRNPPPPDRNPPPPDRNPPKKGRHLGENYKTVSVTLNGNTLIAKDNYLTKSVKLENGYLYRVKTQNYSTIKCTYQKR